MTTPSTPRRWIARLLLPALFLTGVGCANDSREARRAGSVPRYDLYLYANNRSPLDSVPLMEITIDDSTWVKQRIAYSAMSSSNLVQRTTIRGGPHRVRVAFGRFHQDTIVTITRHTSLLASMNYESSYPANNGLVVITEIRDGSGGRD